jgi:hypothetical protein
MSNIETSADRSGQVGNAVHCLQCGNQIQGKNFIDTAVYRGGGSVKAGIDALGFGALLAALVAAALAAVWAGVGYT